MDKVEQHQASVSVLRTGEYALMDDEGNFFSANPADYWQKGDDDQFSTSLMERVALRIELPTGEVFCPTSWRWIRDTPTMGELRYLAKGGRP